MCREMQFYQRMLLIVVACSGLIAAPQAFAAYKQIVAGGFHTCGLKNDGSVTCWGAGTTNTGTTPDYGQNIIPSGTFTEISAGAYHTCGLRSDGSAICWGGGKTNTGIAPESGQSMVPSDTFFTKIQANGYRTCGATRDRGTICWGDNAYGQSTVNQAGFLYAVGWGHTCTLKEINGIGTASCWGVGTSDTKISLEHGQSIVPLLTPSSGSLGFTQLSAGATHTCGLFDGNVVCWGSGKTNTGIDPEYGQSIAPSGAFTQLSLGFVHSCGLKSDGSAVCWGNNGSGRSTAPSGTFTQISAGEYHTCGLKSDGSAVCWGAGTTNTGELPQYGQSMVPVDTTPSPVPVVSQCATHNLFARPQIALPCVNVGGTVYKAGMNLISNTSVMRFEVDMNSLQPSNLIPTEQCAVFPVPNTLDRLRINCLDLGDKYWVDLQLIPNPNPNVIQFDLVSFTKK